MTDTRLVAGSGGNIAPDEESERSIAEARRRLGLRGEIGPDEIERLVDTLDEGTLDDLVARLAPSSRRVLESRQFANVRPLSDEEWMARHGKKD